MDSILSRYVFLFSILVGLLLPFLFNQDRWEGWLLAYLVQTNQSAVLEPWLYDSGWRITWILTRYLMLFANQFSINYEWIFRWSCLLLLIGIGYEVYRIARYIFQLDTEQARWCVALTLVFPGYDFLSCSIYVFLAFYLYLALLGYRWLRSPHRLRQLVGAVLIFISFQVNSILFFIPCFALADVLLSVRSLRYKIRLLSIVAALSLFGFYFYYVFLGMKGAYAQSEYNRITMPHTAQALISLLVVMVKWLTWFVPLLLGVFIARIYGPLAGQPQERDDLPTNRSRRAVPLQSRRQLLAAFLLCFSAIFPYVAVGKASAFFAPVFSPINAVSSHAAAFLAEFYSNGFWSGLNYHTNRLTVLLGPALALAAVVMARFLVRGADARTSRPWMLAVLLGIWLHQCGWMLWAQWAMLKDSAAQRSVVAALQHIPAPTSGATVLFEFRNYPRPRIYIDNEIGYLLYLAYGHTRWVAGVLYPSEHSSHARYVDANLSALKAKLPSQSVASRQQALAGEFSDRHCTTRLVLDIPVFGGLELVRQGLWPDSAVAPARLVENRSDCTD